MVFQDSYNLRRDVDKLLNKTDELENDYFIQVNSPVITYKDEVYTPSTVIATAYQSSREITDFYDDGILDLWESRDGGNSYGNEPIKVVRNGHTISHMISDTTVTNYRINLYDSELNLLDRQSIVIVRTTKGSAGQGYDFIYYTTEKEVIPSSDYPDGDITNLYGKYNEWLQSPKTIDALHPNVFMCYRTSDEEGKWGSWSTPVKYNARGERGEDGEGLEMIFCRTEYADGYNLDPSTLAPVQKDDYVPNNPNSTEWSDDQRGVNSQYCFEYVCMRTKEVPSGSKEGQWSKFSKPKLWATFSEDGADGKGIEFIFKRNNTPNIAPTFEGSGNQRQDKETYSGTVNGKHFYDDDYVPSGWTDDQSGVDENNQCEWVAKRIKQVTNGVASWKSFSDPQLWATFSEDGITVTLGNEAQLIAVNGNGTLKTNPLTIEIPVYCYKGTDRTAGTISLSGVSNYFSTKTVTRQPSASNDGLVTLTCTSVPNQIKNNEPIAVTVNGKTYTKLFTWNKIGDGKDGNAGGTYDFVYFTKNNATPPTINAQTTILDNQGGNTYNAWCARPSNVIETQQYCFGAYRQLDHNGSPTGEYSDVFLWAKFGKDGKRGLDGISTEYIFYLTDTEITDWSQESSTKDPQKWTVQPTTDDYVLANSGWTDDAQGVDENHIFEYCSTRVKTPNSDGEGRWGAFGEPTLWAKFGADGENGADGIGMEQIFRRTTKNQRPNFKNPSTNVNEGVKSFSGTVNNRHFYDDDFVPTLWTDDPIGVDDKYPYEWVAHRMKTPNANGDGEWQSFDTPSLWSNYGYDGNQGIQGVQGVKGRDGTELTGDAIMTKIAGQNIDAQSVGGINPADIITTKLDDTGKVNDSQNSGFYRIMKMGRIVIFSINNYLWTASSTTQNQTVFSLPTWGLPISAQYFPSIPNGDVLSVTAGGAFRCSPQASGTRSLSGSVAYISDESAKSSTTITFNSTSVVMGNDLTITLKSGTTPLSKLPVVFSVNNQTYTRTTNSSGQASLKLNLSPTSYNVTVTFMGNSSYLTTTQTKSVTVTKPSGIVISQVNNHSAKITSGNSSNGTPIADLNCKININGVLYYLNTDYKGILELSPVLKDWKGSVTATITTNDSNKCATTSIGYSFTGTRATQDYTKTLSPSSVGGGNLNTDYSEKNGTKWNYATAGAFANKNDGGYAITDVLSSGATAGGIDITFTTGLSTTAKIKSITVNVRYASLQGWVGASKGSYDAGQSKITVVNGSGSAISGVDQRNFVVSSLGQSQCNTWYDQSYTWSGLSLSNSGSAYNTPAVRITGLRNGGGGYGNNSRFGIDFVQMIITYED